MHIVGDTAEDSRGSARKKGSQRREIPFFSGSRAGVGAMDHRLVSSGFIPFGDVLSLLLL